MVSLLDIIYIKYIDIIVISIYRYYSENVSFIYM